MYNHKHRVDYTTVYISWYIQHATHYKHKKLVSFLIAGHIIYKAAAGFKVKGYFADRIYTKS